MLEVGMKAPDFTLPDKEGKLVSLSDFAGKKVVLYFYPSIQEAESCISLSSRPVYRISSRPVKLRQ